MAETKKGSSSMGIIAFIIAIVAFVMSIIPCVGIIAIVPCIIAIVLAAVGLPQANRNESPRGMLVSGLIIGIVALFISMSQIFVITKIVEHSDDLGAGIEEFLEDLGIDLDLESGAIRIEDDEDTVVIGVDSDGQPLLQITDGDGTSVIISGNKSSNKMLETLEELESEENTSSDNVQTPQGSR